MIDSVKQYLNTVVILLQILLVLFGGNRIFLLTGIIWINLNLRKFFKLIKPCFYVDYFQAPFSELRPDNQAACGALSFYPTLTSTPFQKVGSNFRKNLKNWLAVKALTPLPVPHGAVTGPTRGRLSPTKSQQIFLNLRLFLRLSANILLLECL